VTRDLKDWNSGDRESAVAGEQPINPSPKQQTHETITEELLEIVFSTRSI
jgi:hypothetical protein